MSGTATLDGTTVALTPQVPVTFRTHPGDDGDVHAAGRGHRGSARHRAARHRPVRQRHEPGGQRDAHGRPARAGRGARSRSRRTRTTARSTIPDSRATSWSGRISTTRTPSPRSPVPKGSSTLSALPEAASPSCRVTASSTPSARTCRSGCRSARSPRSRKDCIRSPSEGSTRPGNWGDVASTNIVIDRTAPTISMTAQTPVPGAAVTLSGPVVYPVVNGASSAIQLIEWYVGTDPGVRAARKDGVTIGAATSSIVVPLSALRAGAQNTVFVRALDAAGNWSAAATVGPFTVPLPPAVTLFAYPFDGPLTVSPGNPFSATAWSTQTRPARLAIDTAIKAAGASSLRVSIGALGGTPLRTAWLTSGCATRSTWQRCRWPSICTGRSSVRAARRSSRASTTGVFRLQVRQQGTAANPTYDVRAQYRPRVFFAWSPISQWRNLPAANAFTTLKLAWVDAGGGQNGSLRLTVGATTYAEPEWSQARSAWTACRSARSTACPTRRAERSRGHRLVRPHDALTDPRYGPRRARRRGPYLHPRRPDPDERQHRTSRT